MSKPYETKDFYLAAYLIACGVELLAHKRKNGMTSFLFSPSDELTILVKNYNSLSASVNPVQFGNSIRNLKTIIHSDDVLSNQSQPHVEQYTKCA